MKMQKVNLTKQQEYELVSFFSIRHEILNLEHVLHCHSPFDSLEHYMWEELHENIHVDIYQEYISSGNVNINKWIEEEMREYIQYINSI